MKKICDWKALKKAFSDFVVIFAFTTLASSTSIIAMLINSDEKINWDSIYNNGNIFLYAVSLLSSSYIYYHRKKDKVFSKTIVLLLITFCSVSYTQFMNNKTSTTIFTLYGSISTIIVAAMFFLITQYNQHFEIIDVGDFDKEKQAKIAKLLKF